MDEGAITAADLALSSAAPAIPLKKKRKTVEEERNEREAKLARLEEDNALGREVLCQARSELDALKPLLNRLVRADPRLATIIFGR